MKQIDVSFRPDGSKDKDGKYLHKQVAFKFNMPTYAEAVKAYGEDVAASIFEGALTVAVQGFARNSINRTEKPLKPGAELQKGVDAWIPGKRASGASKLEKLKAKIAALSPEEKKALGLTK